MQIADAIVCVFSISSRMIALMHQSIYVVCFRYQLMEMCWHSVPGQRASLRELRIMLLHLRSAVRENPASSSDFDQKWNQLMPRRIVAAVDHADSRSAAVDVHSVSADTVDVDLGTLSATPRPIGFDSDFSEQNASVVAPDNSAMKAASDASRDPFGVSSPVNEMSLAAELGVFNAAFGNQDENDSVDDSVAAEVNSTNNKPSQQFNIHADVHSENEYAVAYKSGDDDANIRRDVDVMTGNTQLWKKPAGASDPFDDAAETGENIDFDTSNQFSSLNDDQTALNTQKYANYLQTVTTSVDGDDLMSLGGSTEKVSPSGSGETGVDFSEAAAIDDTGEFAEYYRSVAADSGDMAAKEMILGDDTEFAKYYSEQNASEQPQDTAAADLVA